jgi:carbonic anhydrase
LGKLRRHLIQAKEISMRKVNLLLVIMVLMAALAAPAAAAGGARMSADEALARLKEGNDRYLADKPRYPHQGRERRAITAGQGQHPFATVLACADSRVPVELIFDQGIGDLFVVRVAGNVAQTDEIGSIEYAVDHLATPLVLVLGHTQCGAVTAVVENAKLPPHIANLVAPIRPAAAKAKAENPDAAPEALIGAAIRANVLQAMEDLLQRSSIVKAGVRAKKTRVVGALYEIDTGQVQWLGPHPDQDKWLAPKGKGPAAAKKAKKAQPAEE